MRSVLTQALNYLNKSQKWVLLSKGIENKTLLFPSQILDNILSYSSQKAILSGPSFAHDLALKQPTSVMLASQDFAFVQDLKKLVETDYFKVQLTTDIIGTQACAAIKNIIAIATGMLNALGYTDNTKALFITCALQEMAQLCQVINGEKETAYSLAGVGDLILTALGKHSKNLALGQLLGEGKTVEEISMHTQAVPEGINTITSIHELCSRYKISLPLLNSIYQIIFNKKPVKYMLEQLNF